jgi:glyoxylase-like metal-dependent hydrolase (beta-lactamase superfamily II)
MKRKTVLGLFLCVTAGLGMLAGCTKSKPGLAEIGEDGMFAYKVGQFDVFSLVEGEREGNAGILIGVDDDLLSRHIPESGFTHSTNAFLIKAGDRNILIDTGTGQQGEPIYEKIKKQGVEPEGIDTVLITHLHGDHFGGLVKDGQAVFPSAKVYLSAKEYDYFTGEQPNEAAVATLGAYGSEVVTFEPGELGSDLAEVVPGIFPVAAYGHTPGHTMYLLDDGGEKLLIWADLMHVGLVQFPVPEISAVYDMDPVLSAAVRRQVMNYAATNTIPVAGMHLVYPSLGMVEVEDEGFRFVPMK